MRAVAVAERRDDAHAGAFGDVPATIDALYVTPRHFLYRRHGHPVSVEMIRAVLEGLAGAPIV